MKLDATERMAMLEVLTVPTGNYSLLNVLRKTRELLGFDKGEMEVLDFRKRGEEVVFDRAAAKRMWKEIPIDDFTIQFAHDRLDALDKAGNLREEYMPLYEKFVMINPILPEQDEETAARLRELRKGKKTVAVVGFAPSSSSLAPYKEDVELWGLNEMHAFSWMKRATRWFQIHDTFRAKIAKRYIKSHYDWLKKNPWSIPVYMIKAQPEVPNSLDYPIDAVCDLLGGVRRGEDRIRYFCSSFDYMMGVAILEKFERIEVYGIDMASDNEYAKQKPSAEMWIGIALGKGIEVYLPPMCQLMKSDMYGGMEQGSGWSQ